MPSSTTTYLLLSSTSPALSPDGTTVYVQANDGCLYAIDAGNGHQNWVFTVRYTETVWSAPTVAPDGTIYYTNTNVFYAIDPSGIMRWNFTMIATSDSTPAIGADGTVYVGAYGGKLYAFSPSGVLKWTFTAQLGNGFNSPVVDAAGVIYYADALSLYAISPTGSLVWNNTVATTSGPNANLCLQVTRAITLGPNTLYFGCGDGPLMAVSST